MQLLKNIFSAFSNPDSGQTDCWIYVQTHRSKQVLATRINLSNDISLQDDDTYYCRKMLTGKQGRIFEQIEVQLWFAQNKTLVDQKVTGAKFITEEEYQAAQGSAVQDNEIQDDKAQSGAAQDSMVV